MQNRLGIDLTLQCDPCQFSQGKLKGYDLMHVHHSNFYAKMHHYKAQPLERWDFDVTFKCH